MELQGILYRVVVIARDWSTL